MEARDVVAMELTIESKSLATAFFVVKVQGKYNVILGRDCIHANHCIPSTLHQILIQWIDNEIEVVQRTHRLTLVQLTPRLTDSMGAPSAYRRKILYAMTFLTSPRTDLYQCLCSHLSKLSSAM
jgi:hypothetical protein